MATLSYTFFWCGLVALGLASALYGLLTWGSRVVVRQAVTSAGTLAVADRQPFPPLVNRTALLVTWTGIGFLAASMVTRSIATGHPPYSNMFEYLTAFGALTALFAAVFERRYRQPKLNAVALPLAVVWLGLARWLFSPKIQPLLPALQNNRLLALHVACMVISYGALTVAFAAAALYLVQGDGNRYARLPSGRTLELLANRAVLVGFPLLGLGVALGAYWGNIAWGRYWGWDPKETTALVTWLIFAGYLHARNLGGWRGKRAALIIGAGWLMISFNIFAVNFWIAGLHSYAGM